MTIIIATKDTVERTVACFQGECNLLRYCFCLHLVVNRYRFMPNNDKSALKKSTHGLLNLLWLNVRSHDQIREGLWTKSELSESNYAARTTSPDKGLILTYNIVSNANPW